MIDLEGMISIPYLKKAVFTGSYRGMRYLMRRKNGETGDAIEAAAWPGPYIFDKTEDEKKTFREFAFTEEGLCEAIAWLNSWYEGGFRHLIS